MTEGMDEIRLAMIRSLLKLIDEDTKFTIFFAALFFMFAIFKMKRKNNTGMICYPYEEIIKLNPHHIKINYWWMKN